MSVRKGEAAHQRPRRQEGAFAKESDLHRFFQECDDLAGPGREPDWEEHLALIEGSRRRGATEEGSSSGRM